MWQGRLITEEGQRRTLGEVLSVYRAQGIALQCDRRMVPLHHLIATQSSLERDKYQLVLERVRAGTLNVPFIVEEHFVGGRYLRYVVDGHTRVRAHLDLGQRRADAYVLWSPAGDFPSHLVRAAAAYGNVRVKDLHME